MNGGAAAAAKAKADKEKKQTEAEAKKQKEAAAKKKEAEAGGKNVVSLFFIRLRIGTVVFTYHVSFFFVQTVPAVNNNTTTTNDGAPGANKTSIVAGKVGSEDQGQVKAKGQQYVRRRALAGSLLARMFAGI